ncbi:MAG: hypothetical protein Q7T46_08675 [Polaromonas sp.]|nr:hypothetical protein [Polaromonas sp.]
MKKHAWGIFVLAALVLVALTPAHAKDTNLLDLVDKLDKIDRQDLQLVLDKADACTRAGDFGCSRNEHKKAARLVTGAQDKKNLAASQQRLANEQQRVAAERERILAAEWAEKARKKAAEEEEWRRQDQERQQQWARERADDTPSREAPYVPSAIAGMARLQGIQREADRYGENLRAARRAQETRAETPGYRPSAVASNTANSSVERSYSANNAAPPTVVRDEKKRCVLDNRIREDNGVESVARNKVQAELSKVKSSTTSNAGEPMRFLGDSGISCPFKAATSSSHAEYKCSVDYKVEILTIFGCRSSSSGPATGIAR